MKKIILIATAIVATIGMGYAANSLQKVAGQSKCNGTTKCFVCKGTGWNGEFKCSHCKGSGSSNSY
jgi:hypothetical protein